ncbi:hypothetical protein BCR34DRAFT_597856 [Clohesyomyces aquaticus]|uniref:F-box domain-containing protein n=1 Tax=Clohesyomyces aquaticus TaxID=1231657 RepID=A0A1Y2A1A0_9PLEO|nr:hypothetical protein BCR34DRAFT_597856 [Clohesyomyces aquaticus]
MDGKYDGKHPQIDVEDLMSARLVSRKFRDAAKHNMRRLEAISKDEDLARQVKRFDFRCGTMPVDFSGPVDGKTVEEYLPPDVYQELLQIRADDTAWHPEAWMNPDWSFPWFPEELDEQIREKIQEKKGSLIAFLKLDFDLHTAYMNNTKCFVSLDPRYKRIITACEDLSTFQWAPLKMAYCGRFPETFAWKWYTTEQAIGFHVLFSFLLESNIKPEELRIQIPKVESL